MTDHKDPPIEPQDFLSGVTVIDFGDARVARGFSRRPYSACKHNRLVYDKTERRVWCQDCETNVEGFDAFLVMVENYSSAWDWMDRRLKEVKDAMEHSVISRAAKEVDKVWRSRHMAPCCPHCKTALLPEDFANGVKRAVSKELARAYRAAKAMKEPDNG